MTELATARLVLRQWRESDLAPFAALNADPRVMEFYPSVLTRRESDDFVRERIVAHFARRGYGLWAVEVPGVTAFAGYVGLLEHTFASPFTPCVEVGWRLAARYWGRGYATEGAAAALDHGFRTGLDEILSFTATLNTRSIAVMERLGMQRAGDFEHPRLAPGHRLRPHVAYRHSAATWKVARRHNDEEPPRRAAPR
jgi:RimJ/RimL family protein N-acetyltransferase